MKRALVRDRCRSGGGRSRERKWLSKLEVQSRFGWQHDILFARECRAGSASSSACQSPDCRALPAAGQRTNDCAECRPASCPDRCSLATTLSHVLNFVGLHGVAGAIDADLIDHQLEQGVALEFAGGLRGYNRSADFCSDRQNDQSSAR